LSAVVGEADGGCGEVELNERGHKNNTLQNTKKQKKPARQNKNKNTEKYKNFYYAVVKFKKVFFL